MTPQELRSFLPFSAPFYAADSSYAKPTLEWLLGDFWSWYWECRIRLGLLNWNRRNDCDNFARAYSQYAADCHALTSGNDDEGLAVMEFWYKRDQGGKHAIVAAVTDKGIVFIEPQNGKQITLTQQEIDSCYFARA